MKELPKRVQINCIDEETNEVRSKWQTIQYDYLPKYCVNCKIQGHNKKECWNLYPEFRPKKEDIKERSEEQQEKKNNNGKAPIKENNNGNGERKEYGEKKQTNGKEDGEKKQNFNKSKRQPFKVLKSGKVVVNKNDPKNDPNCWKAKDKKEMEGGKNKGIERKEKEVNNQEVSKQKTNTFTSTNNKFSTLVDLEEDEHNGEDGQEYKKQQETKAIRESAKPWVEASFGKQGGGTSAFKQLIEQQTSIEKEQEQCKSQHKVTEGHKGNQMEEETKSQDTERTINDVWEGVNEERQKRRISQESAVQEIDKLIEITETEQQITTYQQVEKEKPPDDVLDKSNEITKEVKDTESSTHNHNNEGRSENADHGDNKMGAEEQTEQQRKNIIEDGEFGENTYSISSNVPENKTNDEERIDDIGDDDEVESTSIPISPSEHNAGDVSPKQITKTKKEGRHHKQNRDKSVPPKAVGGVLTRKAYAKGSLQ
ncbi:uncharacterized protein LOC132637779 [Lycium barbarum]|uniref:uncharacterized protein LOC132637779 n=1 Tax=Lycium barbarum TaxID=112863 RepID=UPI00293E913E|nr:uncharacterized protein LOC132637779 [Lycium barbarum]